MGGTESNNQLIVNKGPVEFNLSYYTIEGVEFVYAELTTKKALRITRTPANDPQWFHLNIVKEPEFTHKYQNENTNINADNQGDVFLYNALFPVEAEFPPNSKVKYIGYKINLNSMGPIFRGLKQLFAELFVEKVGMAYHAPLSSENDRLISDLFAFNKLPHGKVPLITARSLEVLANVVLHFKKEVDQDELAGLHISDFQTLNAIKKKILANLENAYTTEELSREFGVSPTKLKKDFKHLFGSSIYQFYNQSRMNEAYRRLKSGDYSVSEVGYDLGYSSLSKFSSMFKKVIGVLPNEVVKVNS